MNIFLLDVNMKEQEFVVCHNCKYTKTKYRATRHNKSNDKRYYQCMKCESYTTPDDGFWKMRNPEEIISASIEVYYAGVSLRETSDLFFRLFGIKFSRKFWSFHVCKFLNIL